jgi:hypothetical protein
MRASLLRDATQWAPALFIVAATVVASCAAPQRAPSWAETTRITSTVRQIDLKARTITLDGVGRSFTISEGVHNLDQIKVGDPVSVTIRLGTENFVGIIAPKHSWPTEVISLEPYLPDPSKPGGPRHVPDVPDSR